MELKDIKIGKICYFIRESDHKKTLEKFVCFTTDEEEVRFQTVENLHYYLRIADCDVNHFFETYDLETNILTIFGRLNMDTISDTIKLSYLKTLLVYAHHFEYKFNCRLLMMHARDHLSPFNSYNSYNLFSVRNDYYHPGIDDKYFTDLIVKLINDLSLSKHHEINSVII